MYDGIINEILRREGGATFTNRPNDRGSATKFGITQATLSAWRRRPVTPEEVRALTEDEAREIYAERYIYGPRFDQIEDDRLREAVIDAGVNHGQGTAARWLQKAIGGVAVDGRLGRFTLGALAQSDPRHVALRFNAERMEFYGRHIAANYRARRRGETAVDVSENAGGWLARVGEFVRAEAA